MKKSIIFLLLACPIVSWAQLRHYKGHNAIELDGGFIRYGYFGGLSYVHYFSGNFYLKATSFVSRITLTPAKLKVNSVGFDIMPAYTLYKKNAAFFVSAMAGMSFIVSENIKEKDIIGDKANKLGQLKTGFLGGIEMEYYVAEQISLILNWHQKYYFPTDAFGQQRWFCTAGARYNF